MGFHRDSYVKTVAPVCSLLRRAASAIASPAGGIGRHSARGAVVFFPIPFKTPDRPTFARPVEGFPAAARKLLGWHQVHGAAKSSSRLV